MRQLLAAIPIIFLTAACQPTPDSGSTAPVQNPPKTTQKTTKNKETNPTLITPIPPETAAPATSQPNDPPPTLTQPKISRKTISGIHFEGVTYDSRSHQLTIIDQPNGPGSSYSSAQDLATKKRALLAINAGFFTPEGNPLGLVISGGNTTGSWNTASSLGTGIYHQSKSQKPKITRRTSRASVSRSHTLLQSGPLLIENKKKISGLSSQKSAIRSILLTDGNTRWWIGKTSPCTLSALGTALASSSPAPWAIETALNLDGGRSTDLYISSAITGGPINRRSFFNRPVRNFFILKKR